MKKLLVALALLLGLASYADEDVDKLVVMLEQLPSEFTMDWLVKLEKLGKGAKAPEDAWVSTQTTEPQKGTSWILYLTEDGKRICHLSESINIVQSKLSARKDITSILVKGKIYKDWSETGVPFCTPCLCNVWIWQAEAKSSSGKKAQKAQEEAEQALAKAQKDWKDNIAKFKGLVRQLQAQLAKGRK